MAPRVKPGPWVRIRSSIVFALVVALVIGGTYYKNTRVRKLVSVNDTVGGWDSKDRGHRRYTVLTRSNDTGGEYYKLQVVIREGADGFATGKPGSMPPQRALVQAKAFTVVQGVLGYSVNGTQGSASAGQSVVIPAGATHTTWNAGEGDLISELTVRPGTPDETFYEMLAGVGREHDDLSHTSPLELFLIFHHYKVSLPELGRVVEDLAQKVIVPLARMMGLKPFYPEYVSLAGTPLPLGEKAPPKTSMFGLEDPVAPAAPARPQSFFGKHKDTKPAAPTPAAAPQAPEAVLEEVPPAAAVVEEAAAEAVGVVVEPAAAVEEELEPSAVGGGGAAEEEGVAAAPGLVAEEELLGVDAQHMGIAQ